MTVTGLLGVLLGLAMAATGCGEPIGLPQDRLTGNVGPRVVTVAPGETATYEVAIESKRNIDHQVALRLEDVPDVPGLSASLHTTTLPETQDRTTITITTTTQTPEGEHRIYVVATELGQPATSWGDEVTLRIRAVTGEPDFAFSVTPTPLRISEPGRVHVTVTPHSLNRFSGEVRFGVTGLTDDLRLDPCCGDHWYVLLGPSRDEQPFPIRLSFEPAGTVQTPVRLTVTGRAHAIVHTATIEVVLEVSPAPDEPAAPTMPQG